MKKTFFLLCIGMSLGLKQLFAQPGISEIQSYSDYFGNDVYWAFQALCISTAVIFGVAGGLRVYTLWNTGHRQMDAKVIGWLGAAIFAITADWFVYVLFK